MLHHTWPPPLVFVRHAIVSGKRSNRMMMPLQHQRHQRMPFVAHAVSAAEQRSDAAGPPATDANAAAAVPHDNASGDTDVFVRRMPSPPQQHDYWQNRLRDPTVELNQVRIKLKILLHDEYVETGNLDKVLSWVDEIRQKGIDSAPLTKLIDNVMLSQNGEDAEKRRSLVLPLYKAVLRSPEARKFIDRASLYMPAVVNLFRESSATILANVQSFWAQFGCTPAEAKRILPPDQLDKLRDALRAEYIDFLQRLPESEFANILPRLATAIRKNGLFLSAPFATAVDAFRPISSRKSLRAFHAAYAAFMDDAAERRQFGHRLHIYFPWMIKQLQWETTSSKLSIDNRRKQRLNIVLSLLRRIAKPTPSSSLSAGTGAAKLAEVVPPVLLSLVHRTLPVAFSYACETNDFVAADQIWHYAVGGCQNANQSAPSHRVPPYQYRQRGDDDNQPTADGDAVLRFFSDLRCRDVLLFAMHLWTNGSQQRAQQTMHFYMLNNNSNNNKLVHPIMDELNALNVTYRHNLSKAATNADRKKCHREFIQAIRAKLKPPNHL